MGQRCKVFTPIHIVNYMLDVVGYADQLFGKSVLENSCGDGNILCAIVRRYIEDSSGRLVSEIKHGLERDIVGYDVDQNCCDIAKEKLDHVAAEYGIFSVKWNISCADALKKDMSGQFDFIIGNPPYVSYRSMDVSTRNYLRNSFDSCRIGAFDYCYAFIEHSLASLKSNGRMIYLIPSSIFKNVHGSILRQIMLKHVVEVHDYTALNVFEKALTSSALVFCIKDSNQPSIEYYDLAEKREFTICKSRLTDKWMFAKGIYNTYNYQRFGDLFCCSIVIATLLNKAFVLSDYEEKDGIITKGEKKVEIEATRVAISPRSLRNGVKERIIFPYRYEKGCLIRYEEKEFIESFPLATEHLKGYSTELAKRDSDKNAKWFEYGRSQALQHINQDKLLLSTIVTGNVEVYSLKPEDVPYAGIMITRKGDTPLAVAKKLLQSSEFLLYVRAIGTYANGSSLRITPKDIAGFRFPTLLMDSLY